MDLKGQDTQFSQFYANPSYLNPALTGAHSGTYRLTAAYRNQWANSIGQNFKTVSAGGDVRFPIQKGGSYSSGSDIFAAGVMFYSDKVAQFDYDLNSLSLLVAYHKLLSSQYNQYLSLGFQFGLGQRGINYEDLNFGDEFNGVNQYNVPSTEILPANSIAYPDFSMGLHYSVNPSKSNTIYLGASFHHWNKPNISFFDRDLRTGKDYLPFQLSSKYSIHGGASIELTSIFDVQPRAIFIMQGDQSTTTIGSNFKYEFIDSEEIFVHLGLWLRSTKSLTTYQPSDVIFSAAYEKGGMLLGFSYDAHLRKLSANALGTGTFELSIIYTGEHENVNQICPSF